MKTIKTLNSVYEVDEENKRVRRLSGTATSFLPEDGEWVEYEAYYPHAYRDRLVFDGGNGKGFMTSEVQSVDES